MTFSTHPPLGPDDLPHKVSELLRRVENLERLSSRPGTSSDRVAPAVLASRGTNQSIPNNTETFVTWPTEASDTEDWFTAGASVITPTVPGIYACFAYITFEANATNTRLVDLHAYNAAGAAVVCISHSEPGANNLSAAVTTVTCSGLWRLDTIGHTVKVKAFQNSGSALNVTTGEFHVVRLGAL